MNYRHAFNDFAFSDGSKGDNVGRYLFEAYPGRVANVWFNSFGLLPGTTDRNPILAPIQEGRFTVRIRALRPVLVPETRRYLCGCVQWDGLLQATPRVPDGR